MATPEPAPGAFEGLSPQGAAALANEHMRAGLAERLGIEWIEISADGEKVFGGMMTAGESRTFEAKKTFRLTLGNAGGVRVSVDGRPLAPLGRSGQVVRNVVIPDSPSRG